MFAKFKIAVVHAAEHTQRHFRLPRSRSSSGSSSSKLVRRWHLLVTLATFAAQTMAVLTAATSPALASGSYDNSTIATDGLTHVGEDYGQCWTFVRDMIFKASGGTQDITAAGGDTYFAHLRNAGGTQITSLDNLSEGDVVQEGENGGHTFIIVNRVGGSNFTVVDANHDEKGTVMEYQRTIMLDSNDEAFRFGTVVTPPTNPLPSRIGVLATNGTFLVKEGGLNTPWTTEYSGATQGAVTTDLVGVLTTTGNFLVKQGGLSAPWTNEYSGATAIVISSASVNTPLRIGVLTNSGTFLVKEGGLNTPWTTEYSGAKAGYLSGDRIGVISNNGVFLVKDGSLSSPWTTEYSGSTQGTLSGNLIGTLTATGAFLVKDGSLSAPWVDENEGVARGIISDQLGSTSLHIGVLMDNGTFLVKQASLNSPWTTEYSGVMDGSISGDLIGALTSSGTFLAKQGSLSAPWTSEYSSATAIALQSGE